MDEELNLTLRLTAFEELMFFQDLPQAPCYILTQLSFDGCLDRTKLDEAIAIALPQHPLLYSRIERRGRRLFWKTIPETEIKVCWSAEENAPPTMLPVDICAQCGLQVFGQSKNAAGVPGTTLFFFVHHACTDGKGLFRFIEDVLIHYDPDLMPEPSTATSRFDQRTFARRGQFHRTFWKTLCRIPGQSVVGLPGIGKFLMRHPIPVLSHQENEVAASRPPGLPSDYPSIETYELGTEHLNQIRRIAGNASTTLNDFLLALLFAGFEKLRKQYESHTDPDAWLRVMVPMNMREPVDERMPAANIVSGVFIDRQPPAIARRRSLLMGIHDEMQMNKDRLQSFMFIYSIELTRWMPGGLEKATSRQRGSMSCVLTNLGEHFERLVDSQNRNREHASSRIKVGSSTLASVLLWPPLHPGNCMAIGVGSYDNKLAFAIHYDPGIISKKQLDEFFDFMLESISEFKEDPRSDIDQRRV